MKIEEKVACFYQGILNAYRDEDDRIEISKIESFMGRDFTEDMYAMLWAVYTVYRSVCESTETDILGFTHMLNRLAVNYLMKSDEENEP